MATATKTTAAPAKTGTYTVSTSSVATPGTSSAANKTLQQSLISKGANIAADGKYGPATAAAVAQYGGGGGSTTPTTTSTYQNTNPSNPVYDSSSYRASVSALQTQIKDQQAALEKRQAEDAAAINSDYNIAKLSQEATQEKDYASRATGLVTSGGGYLGATQSQEGVLQNLKGTYETEKNALMAKKDEALRASKNAYEDKNFALSKEMLTLAKDMEDQIYKRTQDFNDNTLKIASANRAQTEFDLGIADKKIASYAAMSDLEFAKQDPTEIARLDKQYYPGYTSAARTIAKKALDVKTKKDAISLDIDILDARNKTPVGQKIVLGGQTYTGLKQETGNGTQAERDAIIQSKVSTLFSPGYTIPGTTTPFVDSNGYATPEGWKEAMKISNMDRETFIKQFGHNLYPDNLDNYGLTPKEKILITG